MKYKPLHLFVAFAFIALCIKVLQHNNLVHLTYTHQNLMRTYTQLVHSCTQLRKQHVRQASLSALYATAVNQHGMQPITTSSLIRGEGYA